MTPCLPNLVFLYTIYSYIHVHVVGFEYPLKCSREDNYMLEYYSTFSKPFLDWKKEYSLCSPCACWCVYIFFCIYGLLLLLATVKYVLITDRLLTGGWHGWLALGGIFFSAKIVRSRTNICFVFVRHFFKILFLRTYVCGKNYFCHASAVTICDHKKSRPTFLELYWKKSKKYSAEGVVIWDSGNYSNLKAIWY